MKMSQKDLGKILNLTFQQIQKYENGTNRIGASRLWQLVQALDVTPDFFYDGLPTEAHPAPGFAENEEPAFEGQTGQMTRRETMELVAAYYRIPDPETRKRILEMVKAIGAAFAEEGGLEI